MNGCAPSCPMSRMSHRTNPEPREFEREQRHRPQRRAHAVDRRSARSARGADREPHPASAFPFRRRHGLDRCGQGTPHRARAFRPCGGRRRQRARGARAWARSRHQLSTWGHDDGCVPGARRPTADRAEAAVSPAARFVRSWSPWNRSERAAGRSHAPTARPFGSVQTARAPIPAPRATAWAARSRPSPMPTSCSATSTPNGGSAARSGWISDRARQSVAAIAGAFGVGPEEAALGIRRIANARMARALRRVTVERGVDARRCTLLAFGGAGPMHAVALGARIRNRPGGRAAISRARSRRSVASPRAPAYTEQRTVRMRNTVWDARACGRSAMTSRNGSPNPFWPAGSTRRSWWCAMSRSSGMQGRAARSRRPSFPLATSCRLGNDFLNRHRELFRLRDRRAVGARGGADRGVGTAGGWISRTPSTAPATP